MKRKIASRLLVALAVCITIGCAAPQSASARTLASEEAALGGITAGATMSYVRSVYGEPTRAQSAYDGEKEEGLIRWDYGQGTTIFFRRATGEVRDVIVRANNGFSTPAGAYVGMDASVLQQLYGDDYNAGSPYLDFCGGHMPHDKVRLYVVQEQPQSFHHGIFFEIDDGGKIRSMHMSNAFWG